MALQEFWDKLWKREREFLESGKGEFRHGTSFVAVSSIAEQYYCEYKVENEFALGEVPTEAKDTGTALHDELLPMEEIGKDEFVRLVSGRKPALAVLNVWGTAGGLKVLGTPDHIIWLKGKPLWIVELKTTKGDPHFLWEDQENQVRIYGLLLDLMGFDCTEMRLAVVRIKSGQLDDESKQKWILRVSDALLEGGEHRLEEEFPGIMKVHLLRHERGRAVKAVTSKSAYWLDEREPTSSSSVGKCRACEYSSTCERSLTRPISER